MRMVWVAIRHLPKDSALGRRNLDIEKFHSLTEQMLAETINQLRISNYLYVDAHSESKSEAPEMIDLP